MVKQVALPIKEYLLMELFLNNKNQLFTRSQILNKVWGYDYYGDGRAVDTYIKKLRKKLGDTFTSYSDYYEGRLYIYG